MERSASLVLQAEPGAGKSTALPLSLLEQAWLEGKKIIMLEPRRVAVKSIAHYLAKQLGEPVGQRVGYQIKNERKSGRNTILEIVTEGILTRRLQQDPELSDVALLIFDEFHERSIHADLSLLLALEVQQGLREDLKILLMSATIDTAQISNYLGGAEIVQCEGRSHPVALSYQAATKEPLSRQVIRALGHAMASDEAGDILVFLPSQAEIRRAMAEAQRLYKPEQLLCFALYGSLPLKQQELALLPDSNGRRRAVFSTNIAETSLTINGVSWVIDSGLEKVLVYDPRSDMSRLETSAISKASAEQRMGRAGRTQSGSCIRLWSESAQSSLRDFQTQAIMNSDLGSALLELYLWGVGSYESVNWLTAPPRAHYDAAVASLQALGLLDLRCQITSLGREAAGLGLEPRVATMLLKAQGKLEISLACELAALLSERDIFTQNSGVDIVERLLALHSYMSDRQAASARYPLHRASTEQALSQAGKLKKHFGLAQTGFSESITVLHDTCGKLLIYAFPDRLAKKRENSASRYQLANGRGAFLFEDDPLFSKEWLVVADCDAQKKEGRIFSAAAIDAQTVLACIEPELESKDTFEYDSSRQKIMAYRNTQYGAIVFSQKKLENIPADILQKSFANIIATEGFNVLSWTSACERWLSRAQWLGQHSKNFPDINKASLLASADEWLLPYIGTAKNIGDLKRVSILPLLNACLDWDQQQQLEQEAPEHYQTPSAKTVAIVYDPDQGPTVSVALQEMFGQLESPTLCGVALRFELLSPARRPIQTTSDLGNFWLSSYFDVAKDMRGRYPKHRWPEEPLLEKPGRSFKARKPRSDL